MERTTKQILLVTVLLVGVAGALTVGRYMTASEPAVSEEITTTEVEPATEKLSDEELAAIVEDEDTPESVGVAITETEE